MQIMILCDSTVTPGLRPGEIPRARRQSTAPPLRISNQYPLDLIERDLIVAPVVEAGGSRALVIGHLLRDLELAAVAQVLGDAGGAEGVAADLRRQMPAASARRRIIR